MQKCRRYHHHHRQASTVSGFGSHPAAHHPKRAPHCLLHPLLSAPLGDAPRHVRPRQTITCRAWTSKRHSVAPHTSGQGRQVSAAHLQAIGPRRSMGLLGMSAVCLASGGNRRLQQIDAPAQELIYSTHLRWYRQGSLPGVCLWWVTVSMGRLTDVRVPLTPHQVARPRR